MATVQMLPPPRWTIPPFETGGQIFARLAHLVEPKEALTVSQWARRNTAYDLDALPWHAEVMDALSDPETAEVGLLGPSQAGKSTIGLSWIGWCVDQAPDNFFLCQPGRSATTKFVVTRINPFIAETDTVKAKLLNLPNANNMFLKQFTGMFLYSVWPEPDQFIQVPARYGWLDDFDQMDDDIGGTAEQSGQGSAIKLLEGRLTTRKGRDTKFVSSSPADETGGKTEAFVESGTDERLWPECPSCGDRWQIDLRRDLRFDDTGDEDLAERTVYVTCGNGCDLKPADRRQLLNSLGRLPNKGFVASRTEASRRRRTFRADGLLCFTSWPDLAREWREAQRTWAARQDEGPLRTFINTKGGYNYRSILSGEKPLKSDDLGKRREPDFALGTIPAGVRVWLLLVDAQATSLECAAVGFGDKLESWLIDRWPMHVYADGTPIRPFTDSADRIAEALLPLWRMTFPLADGSGPSPPPLSVTIDTGGGGASKEDSWTATIKAVWHRATGALARGGSGIERKRITLVKGGSNPHSPKLMPPAEFADRKVRGGARRNSPDLWMPNVHRIKNIIDVRLRIAQPGPAYIHLPGADRPGSRKRLASEGAAGISDEYLDEITAEELKSGRWVKLRARNETWDHLVYAYASILKPPFAQSREHMRWVPAPYRVPDQVGPVQVLPVQAALEAAAVAEPAAQHPVVRPARKSAQTWVPRKSGDWLKKRR